MGRGKMIQRNGILLGRVVVAIAFVLAVVVVGAGCRKGGPPPARGPAEVAVVTIAPERVVLTTELPGRTAPFLVAEVRPQVSGILHERLFEEGADVKAGDLLYQIDPAQYQAAFDQAEGGPRRWPRPTSRRSAPGPSASRISSPSAPSASRTYDDAAAALAAEPRPRWRRAARRWRAPASTSPTRRSRRRSRGAIGSSNVTVGALVTAYQPVPLAVDPAARPDLRRRDPVQRRPPAPAARLAERHAQARAADSERQGHGSSSRTARPTRSRARSSSGTSRWTRRTGSVTLRHGLPQPRPRPAARHVRARGRRGGGERAGDPRPAAGRHPRRARATPIAWVVDADGKVEQRHARARPRHRRPWLVTKGLAAGDRVIVEGLQKVRPGDPVKAVPFAPRRPRPRLTGDACRAGTK